MFLMVGLINCSVFFKLFVSIKWVHQFLFMSKKLQLHRIPEFMFTFLVVPMIHSILNGNF